MVSITKFWIEDVIITAYPKFVENGGIDLDGNGRIEGNESFGDFDGDGYIGSRVDYEIYLYNNRNPLSAKIPFLKWGERLSVDNRIHQLMYWLSDLYSAALMHSAYLFIADRVEDANEQLGPQHLSPEEEAYSYYQVMKEAGIIYKEAGIIYNEQDDVSLITNIDDRQLDCGTSSFVAMAIGDERGVKLRGVRAIHHFFLRGKRESGEEFNIDWGIFTSTEEYLSPPFNVLPEQMRDGVYLQTLSDQQVESNFLSARGIVLYTLGRLEESLAAFEQGIEIDKNYADVYNNHGAILYKLGRLEEALDAYDRALEIEKNCANAHYNRGIVLKELGRLKEARAAFKRAHTLDPNLPDH